MKQIVVLALITVATYSVIADAEEKGPSARGYSKVRSSPTKPEDHQPVTVIHSQPLRRALNHETLPDLIRSIRSAHSSQPQPASASYGWGQRSSPAGYQSQQVVPSKGNLISLPFTPSDVVYGAYGQVQSDGSGKQTSSHVPVEMVRVSYNSVKNYQSDGPITSTRSTYSTPATESVRVSYSSNANADQSYGSQKSASAYSGPVQRAQGSYAGSVNDLSLQDSYGPPGGYAVVPDTAARSPDTPYETQNVQISPDSYGSDSGVRNKVPANTVRISIGNNPQSYGALNSANVDSVRISFGEGLKQSTPSSYGGPSAPGVSYGSGSGAVQSSSADSYGSNSLKQAIPVDSVRVSYSGGGQQHYGGQSAPALPEGQRSTSAVSYGSGASTSTDNYDSVIVMPAVRVVNRAEQPYLSESPSSYGGHGQVSTQSVSYGGGHLSTPVNFYKSNAVQVSDSYGSNTIRVAVPREQVGVPYTSSPASSYGSGSSDSYGSNTIRVAVPREQVGVPYTSSPASSYGSGSLRSSDSYGDTSVKTGAPIEAVKVKFTSGASSSSDYQNPSSKFQVPSSFTRVSYTSGTAPADQSYSTQNVGYGSSNAEGSYGSPSQSDGYSYSALRPITPAEPHQTRVTYTTSSVGDKIFDDGQYHPTTYSSGQNSPVSYGSQVSDSSYGAQRTAPAEMVRISYNSPAVASSTYGSQSSSYLDSYDGQASSFSPVYSDAPTTITKFTIDGLASLNDDLVHEGQSQQRYPSLSAADDYTIYQTSPSRYPSSSKAQSNMPKLSYKSLAEPSMTLTRDIYRGQSSTSGKDIPYSSQEQYGLSTVAKSNQASYSSSSYSNEDLKPHRGVSPSKRFPVSTLTSMMKDLDSKDNLEERAVISKNTKKA